MYTPSYNQIKIFAEIELTDYLSKRLSKVVSSIEQENDDYLLNVNENDYVQYKKAAAEIKPLQIHPENIYASSTEKMIPAESFSFNFNVVAGKSYKKDVIKFHIPFSGEKDLLRCKPSTRILWSMPVEIENNDICFEITNFSNNADSIVKEKDSNIRRILHQFEHLSSEVLQYNSSIEGKILNALNNRKDKVMAKSDMLASLGVPIKKTSASDTFSVPTIQKKKKIMVEKPKVIEKNFAPEPCLDNSTYFDILKLIHDVGKEFERLPSIYLGKEEEHLRDHILMMLEPNFIGSATGETFNKSGKTDILLRHENSNVFIGECKFWKGKKSFLNTISQLLGYLTWRDSKAAVIMFVPNKDFSSVVNTVNCNVQEHSNFIRKVDKVEETWLNCEFHINGDRNRVVKLAIMLYHIPK